MFFKTCINTDSASKPGAESRTTGAGGAITTTAFGEKAFSSGMGGRSHWKRARLKIAPASGIAGGCASRISIRRVTAFTVAESRCATTKMRNSPILLTKSRRSTRVVGRANATDKFVSPTGSAYIIALESLYEYWDKFVLFALSFRVGRANAEDCVAESMHRAARRGKGGAEGRRFVYGCIKRAVEWGTIWGQEKRAIARLNEATMAAAKKRIHNQEAHSAADALLAGADDELIQFANLRIAGLSVPDAARTLGIPVARGWYLVKRCAIYISESLAISGREDMIKKIDACMFEPKA